MQSYNFILISFFVFFIYFSSLFLIKIQKITQLQHRRFWNLVLLITFLATGILGLFLAFSIDQKLSLRWYLPLIWYHVEFGIIMALVSLFHTFWHLPYFSAIFKKSINSKK
jgi:spermidine synthase